MIQPTQFDGLEQAMQAFNPFNVLDFRRDPDWGYEHVKLLLIQFTDDGALGLAVYDTKAKEFIEEPGSLEDFGLTPEKVSKKYGFNFADWA